MCCYSEMDKRIRERSVNYSREETEVLISLVEKNKHVIENKKSNAIIWQAKEKAWNNIESEYNSIVGGVYRDAKNLRLKYEAMKRDTRKKSALIRAKMIQTGEKRSELSLTLAEQKVREILLSVEVEPNVYESDQTDAG